MKKVFMLMSIVLILFAARTVISGGYSLFAMDDKINELVESGSRSGVKSVMTVICVVTVILGVLCLFAGMTGILGRLEKCRSLSKVLIIVTGAFAGISAAGGSLGSAVLYIIMFAFIAAYHHLADLGIAFETENSQPQDDKDEEETAPGEEASDN